MKRYSNSPPNHANKKNPTSVGYTFPNFLQSGPIFYFLKPVPSFLDNYKMAVDFNRHIVREVNKPIFKLFETFKTEKCCQPEQW